MSKVFSNFLVEMDVIRKADNPAADIKNLIEIGRCTCPLNDISIKLI